jgi:hypothetical protein
MKYLLCLTMIGIWSGSASNAQQPGHPEVSISISAPSEVKSGSDVYIKIQMTNLSDHPVDCSSYDVSGTDRRFRIDVRDAKGNSMKKGNLHVEMMPGSLKGCTLDPGRSTPAVDDRISWANDVSRSGTYRVKAARVVARDEKNGLVKSNTITITVTANP